MSTPVSIASKPVVFVSGHSDKEYLDLQETTMAELRANEADNDAVLSMYAEAKDLLAKARDNLGKEPPEYDRTARENNINAIEAEAAELLADATEQKELNKSWRKFFEDLWSGHLQRPMKLEPRLLACFDKETLRVFVERGFM